MSELQDETIIDMHGRRLVDPAFRSTLSLVEWDELRSTVIDLRWRPSLEFYEQGVALLRHLEDGGELRGFRVTQHDVQARLRDGAELQVSVVGLAYRLVEGPVDMVASSALLQRVIRAMQPTDTEATFYLQHLIPLDWDVSYEEACARVTSAWMPQLVTSAGVVDSAPLVDGFSPQHRLRFQAEFGVVDAGQAPARLDRSIGNRIGGPALPARGNGVAYPPLGLFVDSSWFPQEAPQGDEDLTVWVTSVLEAALQEAGGLTATLQGTCHTEHPTTDGTEVST